MEKYNISKTSQSPINLKPYESELFERNQSESDQSPIFVEKPKTKIFSARDNKFGPLNS